MKYSQTGKHLSLFLVILCLFAIGAPLVVDDNEDMALEDPRDRRGGGTPPSIEEVPVPLMANQQTGELFEPASFAEIVRLDAGVVTAQDELLTFNQNVHIVGSRICYIGFGRPQPGSTIRQAMRTVCHGGADPNSKLFRLRLKLANGTERLFSSDADNPILTSSTEGSATPGEEETFGTQSAATTTSVPVCTAVDCNPAGKTPIDLLVLYSPEAVTEMGSLDELFTKISEAVEDTNQALCNTKIPARFRVVGATETPGQNDTSDNDIGDYIPFLRDALQGINTSYLPVSLQTLREESRADVVLYVGSHGPNDGSSLNCGASPTGGVPGKDQAVAAINVKNDCKDLIINRHRLAHEMSHVLGLDQIPSTGTARHVYSYGYSSGTSWGTVESSPHITDIIQAFSHATNHSDPEASCRSNNLSAVIGVADQFDSKRSLGAEGDGGGIDLVYDYTDRYNQEFLVLNPRLYYSFCQANAERCYGGVPKPAFGSIVAAVHHSSCNVRNSEQKVDPSLGPDPLATFPWSNWPFCNTASGGPNTSQAKPTTERDLILVGPGTYAESIVLAATSVTLKSLAGPKETIIQAHGEVLPASDFDAGAIRKGWDFSDPNNIRQPRVIDSGWGVGAAVSIVGYRYVDPETQEDLNLVSSGNDVYTPVVDGFTLRGGVVSRSPGGVWCMGQAAPTIRNNVIKDNVSWSGLGAGIGFEGCGGKITNNVITGNSIVQDPSSNYCNIGGYSQVHCNTRRCIRPTFRTADLLHHCYSWQQAGNYYCGNADMNEDGVPDGAPEIPGPCNIPDNNPPGEGSIPLELVTSAPSHTITGGAAIFVSPMCRFFKADLSCDPASQDCISRYWGVDEERGDAASKLCSGSRSSRGVIEISNNIIYNNTYNNQGASDSSPYGTRGAAVFLAAPSTSADSSVTIDPDNLQVKLFHNTISGNSFGFSTSTTSGAGLGCFDDTGSWGSAGTKDRFRNNVVTGNPGLTSKAQNLNCGGWDESYDGVKYNVVIKDPHPTPSPLTLSELFTLGDLNPYNAHTSSFYYRPSANGSGCLGVSRYHALVDQASCDLDMPSDGTSLPRNEDPNVNPYKCGGLPAPDMGALERQESTAECIINSGGAQKTKNMTMIPVQ